MVSADSVDQLSQKMAKVLGDKKLQESMRQKGFEQTDKFSWDKEAKKLLDLFLELDK
jgi:glycosyltransferase involved in cell wall biosynthesis